MTLKIADLSDASGATTAERDYSSYTLRQLLKERYWLDSAGYDSIEQRNLEEEIQKRCACFQHPAVETDSWYRLYGLRFGVFFLVTSVGPFVAVDLLDLLNFLADVNGDNALLSGVWALFTLPFAMMVFMIGAIMDAERVVKWLNL